MLTLFIASVGLVGISTPTAYGASLWKTWSKKPEQPSAIDQLIENERARRNAHIVDRCSRIASEATAQAAAAAAAQATAQAAARKA